MSTAIDKTSAPGAHQWVFVIVQHPENNPQIAGQHDEAAEVAYIPAYFTREDAQQGLLHLTLPKSSRYEIQAFMYDDLCAQARAGSFLVYLVDADGGVLQRLAP
ncbi:MAG: hypothetical protein ABIL58_24025 [Pseudomonadota bacterium]